MASEDVDLDDLDDLDGLSDLSVDSTRYISIRRVRKTSKLARHKKRRVYFSSSPVDVASLGERVCPV